MPAPAQTFFRYFPVSARDRAWGLVVSSAGESHIPPQSPYPPAGHPEAYRFDWAHGRVLGEFALVYLSGGRGWFERRGARPRRVESGDVFMLFPGLWHRYRPDPATGWNEHWVVFDGEWPRRLWQRGFLSPAHALGRPAADEQVLGLFEEALEAIRHQRPALPQLLAGVTAHLLSRFYAARQARAQAEGPALAAVHAAIRAMHRDLAAGLDLPRLARSLHVSYTWFRRRFAQHTGFSPHQYLLQLRLAHARSLLAQPARPLKEIAAAAGFESSAYFCRLFKRKTGLTPGAWRAQARRGAGATL